MTTRRVIVTRAPRLFDASLAVLAEWRAADPLAPVLVVATSGTVGRALVREAAVPSGVAAGLRATTLHGLAGMLAEGRGPGAAPRHPLPPHADRLVVAELLDRLPGPLGARAGRPAVAAAVARTLRDVRQVGRAVLDPGERESLLDGAAEQLHRRDYDAFVHVLELSDLFTKWLDDSAQYDDALMYALAASGPLPALAPRVLVHGVYDVTGSQRGLLDALLPGVDAVWVLPDAPEDSPSAEIVRDTHAWLAGGAGAEGFDDTACAPLPVPRFAAAAGDRAEAREVVRGVLEAAGAGVPFGEMAILLASPTTQMTLFEGELARAGIPVTGTRRAAFAETPAGRLLLAGLAMLAGEADPDQVAALVGRAAESEGAHGLTASAAVSIARRAGCFEADAPAWRARLAALAERQRWLADAAEEAGGNGDGDDSDDDADAGDGTGRAARRSPGELRADAERIDALAALAAGVLTRFDGMRRELAESERAAHASAAWSRFDELLTRVARTAGLDRGVLPARGLFERFASSRVSFRAGHALALVRDVLGETAAMPPDETPPEHEPDGADDDTPRGEPDLAAADGRRPGEGVLLVDLNRARGLRVRRAWCAGLAEDLFASPATPDPVLPDAVRARIAASSGVPLRTSFRRAEEAALLFEFGVAAGAEAVTLSWPRSDDETGRSRYAADAVTRVARTDDTSGAGGRSNADDLRAPVEAPGRSAPSVGDPVRPLLDTHEYDVSALASDDVALWAHLEERPAFVAARACHRARHVERVLTPFDGITGAPAVRASVFSPTALQRIATCPFRYFLRDVLGLQAMPDEAPATAPERLELGRIAHDVLEELFAPLVGADPRRAPPPAEFLEPIPQLVEERVRTARRRGAIGSDSAWAGAERALAAALTRVAFNELAALRASGSRVVALEEEKTKTIRVGDVSLTLRGRPDRVDRDAAGGMVVSDYKYSKGDRLPDGRRKIFDGGTVLQLPVYARLLAEGAEDAGARLRLVAMTAPAGKTAREYDLAQCGGGETLDLLVERLVERVHAGETFQVPDQEGSCKYCDFDALCGPGKERLGQRKSSDERREAHAALRVEFP